MRMHPDQTRSHPGRSPGTRHRALWGLALGMIAGMAAEPGIRVTPLSPAPPHAPGFTPVAAAAAGIDFTNAIAEARSITNRNLLSGSGVALGDIDGDGRPDLYFCGLDSGNALYRNLGNWRFTNITAAAGVGVAGQDSTGAMFSDIDGDGDADLLVNGLGTGTRLFRNDGSARFTEVTDDAGLRSRSGATSLAMADVDADGDLDLYVCHFRPTTILDRPSARFGVELVRGQPVVSSVDGRPVTDPDLADRFVVTPGGEVQELGEPDVLWLNDGQGRFRAAAWTDGTFVDEAGKPLADAPRDWGLAARFGDLNGDGRPDLYVCNDLATPDRVWINETAAGHLRFRALDTHALRGNPTFSMGVDFADFDRNGHVDLFAVDMLSRDRALRQTQLAAMAPEFRPPGLIDDRVQMKRNVLALNRGDGTFADVSHRAGVAASEWSWGPIALDVDLDGFEDLLISNGQHRDFQDSDGAERIQAAQRGGRRLGPGEIADLVRSFPRLVTANLAFRNRGDGTFEDASRAWGFDTAAISQGMAVADLDGDGDLDVVTNDLNAPPGLYRNGTAAPRILVRLHGSSGNPDGIGAALRWIPPGGSPLPVQTAEMVAGGRYLGGDHPARSFAVPPAGGGTLEVRWPDGHRSRVEKVQAGHRYDLTLPTGPVPDAPPWNPAPDAPHFTDASDRARHVHTDEPFDDFARQPLMPNRLSQLGPGVTWADIDGDGREDLVVGTGKGGGLGVLLNDGQGGFRRSEEPVFSKPAGRDLTTLLHIPGVLLAGSSNYEDGMTNGGHLRIFDLGRKASGEAVLGPGFSVGPLAMADVDGDGTPEVFIGGRSVAGRYPDPADALVVRLAGGRLSVGQRLDRVGLVSGACFSDLDADGDPDLVLAAEWSPPRVFRNDRGQLHDATREFGLEGYTGWWNGVATGDFDGNGLPDLVLSNWGDNTPFHASPEGPRRLYAGDFAGLGSLDLIETWVDPVTRQEWPGREFPFLRMMFPHLAEPIGTFTAYSTSTVRQVYGDLLDTGRRLEATTLRSMLFLNRGGRFEARDLPDEAQWAPAFAVCVADYDGDGAEDVFLSQNWFSAQPMVQRSDAGRGLWLRGDGHGGFKADLLSGIRVYGEGRGAAVADYDADGRIDLAVAQNAAPLTLWHNERARPGLRVRLEGPPSNPTGLGAAVRLDYGDRQGPWREIQAGSGYGSVNSPVQVLGLAGTPVAIEVRWPGGRALRHPLASVPAEVRLRPDGSLKTSP